MGCALRGQVERIHEFHGAIDRPKDRSGRACTPMRVDRPMGGSVGSHRYPSDGMGASMFDVGPKVQGALRAARNPPAALACRGRAAALVAWRAAAPPDVSGMARTLGDLAHAKGMSEVGKRAALGWQRFCRARSADGNPGLATVLKVARAPGLRLCMGSRVRRAAVDDFGVLRAVGRHPKKATSTTSPRETPSCRARR
jgi:probable addiction module antidote protein